MKIYSKKLNSVQALRREKIRLEYEKKHTSKSDFFPIKEVGKKSNTGNNFLQFAIDLVTSGSGLKAAITIAKPLLRMIGKSSKKKGVNLIKEVGTGYLKWKAIEIGYRGIRLFLKNRKAKQDRKKAYNHPVH